MSSHTIASRLRTKDPFRTKGNPDVPRDLLIGLLTELTKACAFLERPRSM
jgi:hypothetical protein